MGLFLDALPRNHQSIKHHTRLWSFSLNCAECHMFNIPYSLKMENSKAFSRNISSKEYKKTDCMEVYGKMGKTLSWTVYVPVSWWEQPTLPQLKPIVSYWNISSALPFKLLQPAHSCWVVWEPLCNPPPPPPFMQFPSQMPPLACAFGGLAAARATPQFSHLCIWNIRRREQSLHTAMFNGGCGSAGFFKFRVLILK